MRHDSTRARGLSVGALAAACSLLAVAPASAANPAGVASLGSADFTKSGQAPVAVPALASCDVHEQTSNSSGLVSGPGVRFGGGTSRCTTTVVDAGSGETTTSEASGKDFELSALLSVGGPRIGLESYKVTCTASSQGTKPSWTFSGLSGISGLPERIPSNHVHQVTKADGTVLAEVVFNEVIVPEPGDGSVALNALHITFAPASQITGDVVIGATACAPAG
ncbi:hypothetical protein [Streptomyces sp. NPDC058572]|uniref:hypothetical protein n=1 Tax=Streptomyces sp. NPDC058572 TaxID=3346546 RepID=UPI00364D34BB